MYGFFAEYVSPEKTVISILDPDGKTIASRDVRIAKASFIQSLTNEMITLSHEQELYHNDIFGIGIIVNPTRTLEWETEQQFKRDVEASFGFKAFVGESRDAVKSWLLTSAS